MKITVTAEDIRDGVPNQPFKCAVALAGRRATKKVVSVDERSIYVGGRGYDLPKRAKRFIKEFDFNIHGKLFKPFTFDLPIDLEKL